MEKSEIVVIDGDNTSVTILKSDLIASWSVLENLAVSLDQIGGVCAEPNGASRGKGVFNAQKLMDAVRAYLTPELVQAINEARARLGRYIPDEEAEAVSERVAYWDYGSS